MQDDKAIQEDLDRAQADLEFKVGQLKVVVMHKLEKPRRVVAAVQEAIAFVRAHPALLACAAVTVLLLLRWRRAMAHTR
jgi:hypothetical protein